MQDHSQEDNNNGKNETIEYTTQDDTTRRPETRRTGTKRDTAQHLYHMLEHPEDRLGERLLQWTN